MEYLVFYTIFFFLPMLVYMSIYMMLHRHNPAKYPLRKKPISPYSYAPFPRFEILGKADKTAKLLAFIAAQDKAMAANILASVALSTFLKVQAAWVGRDYAPVKDLLMPDIFNEHSLLIASMIKKHEMNLLDSLIIENIDIVNLRYTHHKHQREFTALITANAVNYIVEDRSGKFIIGDNESSSFQEFWTFQWHPSGWRLRNIEQPNESTYLIRENLFEQYTDRQVEKVYGGAVDILGMPGALLPDSIELMETQAERLLNFLVLSEYSWSQQAMVDRASLALTSVHLDIESGELSTDTTCHLYPEVIKTLKERIAESHAEGYSLQYHYLRVRNVKIINVQNYDNPNQDEFTVRVSFQAKTTLRKNNKVVKEDRGVRLFVEYWSFGRLDNQWKIKKPLPLNSELDKMKNIDEGTTVDMMKWYYKSKRPV